MLFDPGRRSYWRRVPALIASLVLSAVTATAETYYVAPVPSGSDANDCLSPSKACASFQRAVDLCPTGAHCSIVPAPGIYSQKTNVFYYKVISVSGPYDKNQNCIDRGAVVVDDRINSVGQTGPIFMVQDHAILTISCMTLSGYTKGSVGFATRQFAIGDVNDTNFLQFPEGYGVAANETSKINVSSPGIYGNSSRFASAADLSQVTLGGTIRIGDGLTFEVAFLSALFNSVVLVYPSEIVGGAGMSGASYQCRDSIIQKNVILPGGDVSYGENENCSVFGLAPEKVVVKLVPELKAIRRELDDKLNPELKAIRSELDDKLNPELKAIRSELDDKLNPELKAIRTDQDKLDVELKAIRTERNVIITVLAVLTITAMAGAFYVWQQHWRR